MKMEKQVTAKELQTRYDHIKALIEIYNSRLKEFTHQYRIDNNYPIVGTEYINRKGVEEKLDLEGYYSLDLSYGSSGTSAVHRKKNGDWGSKRQHPKFPETLNRLAIYGISPYDIKTLAEGKSVF